VVGGYCVVLGVLGVAFSTSVAVAEPDADQGRIAVLVGGGAGLDGLGGIPAGLIEGHVGAGWRKSEWTAAAMATYATSESEALLVDRSIRRRDIQIVGLLTLRPSHHSGFHIHGQLGGGVAHDTLRECGAITATATGAVVSVGAGIGWRPLALTFRFVGRDAQLCSGIACFQNGGTVQALLSLTFDLGIIGEI